MENLAAHMEATNFPRRSVLEEEEELQVWVELVAQQSNSKQWNRWHWKAPFQWMACEEIRVLRNITRVVAVEAEEACGLQHLFLRVADR